MTDEELIAAHHIDQERRGLRPNSIRRRDQAVQVFARSLGERSPLEATTADVETFLDARPIGPRTRYLWLTHLHNFCEWVVRDEIRTTDPTARIIRPRLPRALPTSATSVELRAALEQADPTRRCWLLLAALMGLRCQEMAGMSRRDVLESEGLLRVVKGKGGVERILPVHPEVPAALDALPMPRVGWVFTRPRGGPYPAAQLSHDFNIFLQSAGVSRSAHTLRHWFGTNLYAQTHDIRLTQEMLGHANMVTTAIYTAFDRRAAGQAVEALNFDPDPPKPTSGQIRHLRSVS